MHSMYPSHQVFDAVIFGSGLAGLSCARRLALSGKKVAVLEKSKELGGHLLPFERSGVQFEVGLHYIADAGQGSRFSLALDKLDVDLTRVDLDREFETLCFEDAAAENDREMSYSRPVARFEAELKQRYPENSQSISRYFSALEMVWKLMQNVEFPVTNKNVIKSFLKSEGKFRLGRLAFQTLGQFLDQLNIQGKLREILVVHHVLIGVPPSKVSALLHLVVQRYYFENACFIRGGGRAMIDALKHPEVEYQTSCDASFERISDVQLVTTGARFKVTGSDGRVLLARNVIWTPDPRLLSEHFIHGQVSTLVHEKLRRAQAPHALVVGYFATRKSLTEYGLNNRNYWFMGRLDSEASYLESDLKRLAKDSPLYISTGSLRDPEALRPGNKLGAGGVFQAMFLCPPTSELWGGENADGYRVPESKGGFGRHYRVTKEEILKTLTQRIVNYWPALEGELVWCELGTPLTHRRYLNSITLNGYGFAPTVSDLIWTRPGAQTGEDGLYFCGAHIRPAHGIVTALLNGVGLADSLGT